MRRVWIEILSLITVKKIAMSPSMRRVWIEIDEFWHGRSTANVTLHAEGVD